MKTAVILFAASDSRFLFEKAFGGRSAYERTLSWASAVPGASGIFVFASPLNSTVCRREAQNAGVPVILKEDGGWTLSRLLDALAAAAAEVDAEAAVFAFADCPFLDTALTAELTLTHEKYAAEYTFADGYPYGLAPEVLDRGTAAILSSLAGSAQQKLGAAAVTRNGIMTLLKTDINSFEIETVLSPRDWRLYRFEFACGTTAGFAACRAMYAASEGKKQDAERLSETAAGLVSVLKTVPGFYNVQIEQGCPGSCTYCPYPRECEKKYGYAPSSGQASRMTLEQFKPLVRQMAELSGSAVVSLSAWGEPLLHPEFVDFVRAAAEEDGLSVMVETDGLLVQKNCAKACVQPRAEK